MGDACCGSDPVVPPKQLPPETTAPPIVAGEEACACCDPVESVARRTSTAPAAPVGDACCVDDGHGDPDTEPTRLRNVMSVRLAAVSGALLAAGWLVERFASEPVGAALTIGALLVGGWTFVPDSLRALVRGRLGVGTLMTVAAIGADVCPSSKGDIDLANRLTMAAMNFGTASSFLPFVCRTR